MNIKFISRICTFHRHPKHLAHMISLATIIILGIVFVFIPTTSAISNQGVPIPWNSNPSPTPSNFNVHDLLNRIKNEYDGDLLLENYMVTGWAGGGGTLFSPPTVIVYVGDNSHFTLYQNSLYGGNWQENGTIGAHYACWYNVATSDLNNCGTAIDVPAEYRPVWDVYALHFTSTYTIPSFITGYQQDTLAPPPQEMEPVLMAQVQKFHLRANSIPNPVPYVNPPLQGITYSIWDESNQNQIYSYTFDDGEVHYFHYDFNKLGTYHLHATYTVNMLQDPQSYHLTTKDLTINIDNGSDQFIDNSGTIAPLYKNCQELYPIGLSFSAPNGSITNIGPLIGCELENFNLSVTKALSDMFSWLIVPSNDMLSALYAAFNQTVVAKMGFLFYPFIWIGNFFSDLIGTTTNCHLTFGTIFSGHAVSYNACTFENELPTFFTWFQTVLIGVTSFGLIWALLAKIKGVLDGDN